MAKEVPSTDFFLAFEAKVDFSRLVPKVEHCKNLYIIKFCRTKRSTLRRLRRPTTWWSRESIASLSKTWRSGLTFRLLSVRQITWRTGTTFSTRESLISLTMRRRSFRLDSPLKNYHLMWEERSLCIPVKGRIQRRRLMRWTSMIRFHQVAQRIWKW